MPELPEVETVRRGLLPLVGATIKNAEVLRERSVRHHDGGKPAFEAEALGLVITAAVRRGKFLWLLLDSPDPSCCASEAQTQNLSAPKAALLVHLGMSGQLRRWDAPPAPHPHLRVRLQLELPSGEPAGLDFIDQRTFGHLTIVDLTETADGKPGGEGDLLAALPVPAAHIARDVLDPDLDISALVTKIKSKNTEIKRVLLDQTAVSGIGNIYADEALWQARIHPQTSAATLSKPKIRELIASAQSIIAKSLEFGGTSFDSLYVNVNGESGTNSENLAVYGREGEPCLRCGTLIKRVTFMNRSSHYCPRCQRRR